MNIYMGMMWLSMIYIDWTELTWIEWSYVVVRRLSQDQAEIEYLTGECQRLSVELEKTSGLKDELGCYKLKLEQLEHETSEKVEAYSCILSYSCIHAIHIFIPYVYFSYSENVNNMIHIFIFENYLSRFMYHTYTYFIMSLYSYTHKIFT